MPIQVVTQSGTSQALSNSVRTQYVENYLEGALYNRLYDQIAVPVGRPMSQLKRGSSVQVNFLSDMEPGTSAISEVTDLVPQALRDATVTVTPTSRGEALQASEKLGIQAFTDYSAKMSQRVGANMAETVDSLARDAATQGSLVLRDPSSRTALDAGATGHRADNVIFLRASGMIQQLKIPGFMDRKNGNPAWPAIMHPMVYHDILRSGSVTPHAQYVDIEMLFNHEVAEISGFRLIVSPWAKVFYGAGADHATPVSSTASTGISALDKTFNIAATSSVENGEYLNFLDTRETANTHVSTNERARYVSASAKTITVVGEGANGGFRFDHASGITVNNNDSAYTIVFGGRDSLAKVFATEIGEFGQIVGPKKQGFIDQWESLGWKWYGGYGRLRENGLLRYEVSVSTEA